MASDKTKIRDAWIAEFVSDYSGPMTDATRLLLLGIYFDKAFNHGAIEGIDSVAEMVSKKVQEQAL